jgi:hypothetical protein
MARGSYGKDSWFSPSEKKGSNPLRATRSNTRLRIPTAEEPASKPGQCEFESHRRYVVQHAGWSSLVARKAHNLEVVGSNPSPATQCNQCRVSSVEATGKGGHGT